MWLKRHSPLLWRAENISCVWSDEEAETFITFMKLINTWLASCIPAFELWLKLSPWHHHLLQCFNGRDRRYSATCCSSEWICLSDRPSVCLSVFGSCLWSDLSQSHICSWSGQQRSGRQTWDLHTLQVTHTPTHTPPSSLKNAAAAKLAGKAETHRAAEGASSRLSAQFFCHWPNVVCDTFWGAALTETPPPHTHTHTHSHTNNM